MGLFSKKSAPQPSARPEYIEVGQIVNTHGVRGEVKVQPWDVSPELLCGFKTFYMDGAPFRPTSKRVQGDMVLMKLPEVDDYPYGGGRGAVMQADPLYRCWAHVCEEAGSRGHTIYLSPCGRTFTQSVARELKDKYDHLILVCGHYEGIDQRFIDECVDEELSMGDFVVTGGEIPAMAVTDAICRMVPGVLPGEECFTEESHWAGLLEYPQYSRPDEWHGRRVPDVLLSGHHENVAKWRKKESYKRTMLRRPDMWAQFDEKQLKTKSEKKVLAEARAEAEAIRAAEVKKAEESDTETPVE